MNKKRTSMMWICLSVVLALSPALGLAQGTTTFSGEAVALKANVLGISLSLADTGQLPPELCTHFFVRHAGRGVV